MGIVFALGANTIPSDYSGIAYFDLLILFVGLNWFAISYAWALWETIECD
jgi:hypothetical protein